MAKIWTREENELLKELTLKGKSRQGCKNLIEKLYYNSNISLDRKAIKSKELINL